MKVLVTGASGSVGGLVCQGLLEKGVETRVLIRDLNRAPQNQDITVFQGNLANAESCREAVTGVDVVFLLLTYDGDPGLARILKDVGVQKVVAVQDGTVYPIETALREIGIPLVMLYPVEFMKNAATYWCDSIRYECVARTPFPDAKGAPIHEADVADAALAVIMGDGHIGQSYCLTGPEVTTPRKRVGAISNAIGKSVRLEVQTEEEARSEYASWGFTPELIEFAITTSKNPEPYMYQVLSTVEDLTGHPARTFQEWAEDHREDFV